MRIPRSLRSPLHVGLVLAMTAVTVAAVGMAYLRTSETRSLPEVVETLPSYSPLPMLTESPSPPPSPHPSPSPRLSPSPKPSPKPAPKPKPAAPAGADLTPFRRLGTWVDVYDYGLDPEDTAAAMRARGVKALFIQTGRYTLPGTFKDENALEAWVRATHANGMKIVGWYLPGYGNLQRDIDRTVAIARLRTADGQSFDGIGVDIEDKCELKGSTCDGVDPSPTLTQDEWNRRIISHSLSVRHLIGATFPMAAITPPPLGMAIRPAHWTGFPWAEFSKGFNLVMPMSYWSYRDDCAEDSSHCAYGYTKGNISETRRLTGSRLPVNIAGGVADEISDAEVADFVRAAREMRVLGGNLYDYRTTESADWGKIDDLNTL